MNFDHFWASINFYSYPLQKICLIVCPSSMSRRSFTYIQNSRGPKREPCGTPKLVSSQSELPFLLVITIWEQPCKYDLIHRRADLENSSWRSFRSSFDGDTVSKALLKSNDNNIVTFFLSMAMRISSVRLRPCETVNFNIF